MIPMMGGGHEDNSNQGKAHHIVTTTLATRATRIASIYKEDSNKYSP
jgi:hypothetical protein